MAKRTKTKKPKKRSPGMVKSPWSQAQVDAIVAARDRTAVGNPRLVRRAFLGGNPVQIGAICIGPLTIGAYSFLEEIGNPFAVRFSAGEVQQRAFYRHVTEAAYVLAETNAARLAWQRGQEEFAAGVFAFAGAIPQTDLWAIFSCVTARMKETADTMPPGNAKGIVDAGGKGMGIPDKNPGLGWGLVLLHQLMATYGGMPHYWQWECPLPLAFVLYAAIQVSSGAKQTGPSYAELEMLEALRAADPAATEAQPARADKNRAKGSTKTRRESIAAVPRRPRGS